MTYEIINTADRSRKFIHDGARPYAVISSEGRCVGRYETRKGAAARAAKLRA